MASSNPSTHTSPTESDFEKRELRHEVESEETRREEEESEGGAAKAADETQISEKARSRTHSLKTERPLELIRSRSSARYTDGYSHFDVDEEGGQAGAGEDRSPEPGKEFEVAFDGESDPWNPRKKTTGRKWAIVLVGSLCSLSVTCASALYTSTYTQMEKDYHIGREAATTGLTTFVSGLGLGPMFLAPLSEFYGRRVIFLCSFGMYFIWQIACAVAPNLGAMLVFRFFDGLAGSAFLSVAGGVVGDMFTKDKLSAPMIIYTASPFIGPEVGPVIGGFINSFANWRWSFWVLVIWAAVQWFAILLIVPETYAPVVLRRKAAKLRQETGDERWYAPIEKMDRSVARTVIVSCYRPFQLLFLEQMCLNLCLLSAMLLGMLYLFFGAFELVFQNNHGFNEWQTGLTFLGIFVGMVIGVCLDPVWQRNYRRLVRENGGVSEPEFRLPPTILGAVLIPVSLFGFGWTTFKWVPWIAPIIFSAVFGCGNILCFGGIFTFLVECYPLYAASALAANSFARSAFAAAFPLFGVQMYQTLGYQWASSLLGFITLVLTPFPLLFFKYGKRLRARSRFAQTS